MVVQQSAEAGSITLPGNEFSSSPVAVKYNPRLEVGTGAFNLEMWVKERSRYASGGYYTASLWSSTMQYFYGDLPSISSFKVGLSFDGESLYTSWQGNQNQFYPAGNDTGWTDLLTTNTKTSKQIYETFTDKAWHHIAVSKSAVGGTLSMYLDGVRVLFIGSDTHTYSLLGGDAVIGGDGFVGQITDVRLVKGQALYSGPSINVPTSQITTTSQGAIPSNVSLLLKADGKSCAIKDYSDYQSLNVITISAGASCSSLQSRATTSFNLKFDTQGHGIKPIDMANINSTLVTNLPVLDNDGFFTFRGWSTTPTGLPLTGTYTASADSTLYAIWRDDTPGVAAGSYTVTYSLGGGRGTLPTQSAVVGGQSFMTASSSGLTKTDYVFNKWSDGSAQTAASTSYTMPNFGVTLTAMWSPKCGSHIYGIRDRRGNWIVPHTPCLP